MGLKFIKNNSQVDKKYFGAGIAPGEFIEIPPVYNVQFATDSNLLTDIGSGEAKISRTDDELGIIENVNEAITYLRDEIIFVSNQSITTIPKISSKFKFEVLGQEVSLSSEYQEVYSYLGKNDFFGFVLKFNSSLCALKLTIDDNIIIEVELYKLLEITKFTSNGNSNISNNMMISVDNQNTVSMCLPYPIESLSYVKIEAKETKSNKKFESGIVFISKG